MKSVLITGIGGDIAQGVAKILRQRWPEFRIYGSDTHGQHGGSLFSDECFTLPKAAEPEYVDALRSLLVSRCIDWLLPMTEPELEALSQSNDETICACCVYAGRSVVGAGIDKMATYEALRRSGLPAPWTIPVGEGAPSSYPCILKPRRGSGSRSVFIVSDKSDALHLAKRHPDAVYQELLEPADREVTAAVYRTRDGRTKSLLLLRRLTGGFTGWAQVIDDPESSRICEILARDLDLSGSMNVQLRLTDAGPRVFEINPRISSTVLMRHYLGFNDAVWMFEERLGKKVEFPEIPPGKVAVRTQGAAILG